MEYKVPVELEELVLCSCCHLPFNDCDLAPKLFSCRHYFCLKCAGSVLMKGAELYCIHCWKRTELLGPEMKPDSLPTHTSILYLLKCLLSSTNNTFRSLSNKGQGDSLSFASGFLMPANANKLNKGENCLTHAMPNSLWCTKCNNIVCRGCASTDEHRNHLLKTHAEAKEILANDISTEMVNMQKSMSELQELVFKQKNFLLKVLETCTSLKTQIEAELTNHLPTYEVAEMRESLSKVKNCLSLLDTEQSPVEAFKLHCNINIEKQRIQTKHNELLLKCKLDDLVRNCATLFDFDTFKQAIINITSSDSNNLQMLNGSIGHSNSMLLLANYCISQLYLRSTLTSKQSQLMGNGNSVQNPIMLNLSNLNVNASGNEATGGGIISSPDEKLISNRFTEFSQLARAFNLSNFGQLMEPVSVQKNSSGSRASLINVYVPENGMAIQIPMLQHSNNGSSPIGNTAAAILPASSNQTPTLLCNPNVHIYPIYFFNIEVNGQPFGRILIEVRNDVAPKMSRNFGVLATGELGYGYKGCTIFQCWENESIITGDFELNNGRGGRSVFEEGFFMPDDTKILAIRGSVGMRRSQKRHDNMGLVGSQFRVILREMRGFTGIFAFVVEGLELVEKISQTGDSAGKPQSNVVIVNCGKLQ